MKKILVSFLFLLILLHSNLSQASSYKHELKKWTRSGQTYHLKNFGASILWKAVFLSPKLVQKQGELLNQKYTESPVVAEKQAGSADGNVFFVTFYSDEKRDFDLSLEKSQWKLVLSTPTGTFFPVRIQKIEKYPNQVRRLLYPFLQPWFHSYYVVFADETSLSGSPFDLKIEGAFSSSTLRWK